jgi:hypothetical protein
VEGARVKLLAAALLCVAAAGAAAQPLVKGVELYTWTEQGDWRFSLLPGTNRLKSEGEIRAAAAALEGAGDLKRALGKLPRGETVVWSGPEWPDEGRRGEIAALCRALSLALQGGAR